MNHLAQENSLYLRQHADNPVNWHAWGEQAWAEARERDCPVIVSIGYSACHWCHVMAHESFEDDYIAGLMNEHFVCIKLDREERPDLDRIYMEAVQMLGQRGGWPLNVFCLPDGRPFFGGTYFPAKDRGHGIIPWPQLLMRVAEHFRKSREELEENAGNIQKNMVAGNAPLGHQEGKALENSQLLQAAQGILQNFDREDGGFGQAPKFPPAMTLGFLLELRLAAACESRPQFAATIDEAVRKTCDRMARGGLFDQLGGGFARYSVDAQWVIPHFEKMLYDNALLLDAYSRAYARYRDPLHRAVVSETVAWLEREMRAPGGAWYASLDADSEGEEGKYYVWLPDEVKRILGPEDGERFCRAYGITEQGNFEHGTSNPVQAFSDFGKREELAPLRAKLLAAREQRVRPGRDTKQLTAWNGLLIRGLAEAAFTFDQPAWHARAAEAAAFLWEHLATTGADGETRLRSVYYAPEDTSDGVGAGPRFTGTFEDYAWLAEGLLALAAKAELFAAGSAAGHIERARQLVASIQRHFSDPDGPGCFTTADDAPDVPVARKKDWFDNAYPAGHSSYLHALTQLHALNGESAYADEAAALREAYPEFAARAPQAVAHALAAFTAEAVGIAVIKFKGVTGEELRALADALRGSDEAPKPARRVFLVDASEEADAPEGFQLCVGTQCLEPTRDGAALAEHL